MINKKIKTFLFVMAGLLVLVLLFVLVTTLYQKSVLEERREALIKTISDLWELRDQLKGTRISCKQWSMQNKEPGSWV